MATRKALVHFGQHTRPITFELQGSAEKTHKAIMESIKVTFSDQLVDIAERTLILQIRDDDWGGTFVDLLTQDVPDRSILQVVVKHSQVIYFFVDINKDFATPILGTPLWMTTSKNVGRSILNYM